MNAPKTFEILAPTGEPLLQVTIHADGLAPEDIVAALELRELLASVPELLLRLKQDPGIDPLVIDGAAWLYNCLRGEGQG